MDGAPPSTPATTAARATWRADGVAEAGMRPLCPACPASNLSLAECQSASPDGSAMAGYTVAMPMGVVERHYITESGDPDGQPMLFAHGFGCDQNMWRLVAPRFEDRFRVVLFDYVGAGRSDLSAYDPERYGDLGGYADDVLEICRELDLHDVVFVGHSVSSMIGLLAAAEEPSRFDKLVMVGPSPRYIDDERLRRRLQPRATSTSCSGRSRATTSGGRARWRR